MLLHVVRIKSSNGVVYFISTYPTKVVTLVANQMRKAKVFINC